MIRSDGFREIGRAFQSRNFTLFQIGRFVQHVTMWMYRMAMGWLVWDITGSATWLGIIAFVDLMPSVVVSPLAGVLADRFDRMRLLRITQINGIIQAIALSAYVLLGFRMIEPIVLLALYNGIVFGVQIPTTHAIIPSLIDRSQYTTAYGINSISFNLARFVGPAVAGFIVSAWGAGPVILCYAVGAAIFYLTLVMMDLDSTEVSGEANIRNFLKDLIDGGRYVVRHPGIGPLMLIMILLGLLTFSIVEMLPGFADDVFHSGANGLAWLIAILGLGALFQGTVLAQRGPIAGLTHYFNLHILVIGIFFVALTLTENYWVGLAAVFVIGFATAANRVAPLTLIQNAVAGDMRGRISSFWSVIYHACPAVGALVIGAFADLFGLRPTFAALGLLTVGLWLWVVRREAALARALEATPGDEAPRPTEGAEAKAH